MPPPERPSSTRSTLTTLGALACGAVALAAAFTVSLRTTDTAAALMPSVEEQRVSSTPVSEAPEPVLRGGAQATEEPWSARVRRRLAETAVLDERALRRILIEFSAARTGVPDAGDRLVEALCTLSSAKNESDPTVRRCAVALLARVDRALLLSDPFTALFSDPDPVIRAEAVRGRAAHGLVGQIPAVVALSADPDPRVRSATAEALGTVQDEQGAAALQSLLFDPDRGVGTAAARALVRTWRGPLPARLVEAAGSESANARLAATVALRDMRCERSTELLSWLCVDEDWQVREAAVEALGRARRASLATAAERLVAVACDDAAPRHDRFLSLQALVRLGDAGADPRVSAVAAASPDPVLRVVACRTALSYGDGRALDSLVELLDVRTGPLCDDEDMQFVHRVARSTLRDVTGSDSEATDSRAWRQELVAFRSRSAGAVPSYTPAVLDSFR